MRKFTALIALFAAIALVGCNKNESTDNKTPAKTSSNNNAAKTAVATIGPSKAAATQPANKDVTGTVTFTATKDGVKVVADLTGLSPGKHGIHIHEKSDLSDPMLKTAGGHWDPDAAHHHGGPTSETHHAGDMGNITADADGKAHLEMDIGGLTIGDGGKHDVVGRSVVVHAKEDDLKSDPAGNSGDRIAAGVIDAK